MENRPSLIRDDRKVNYIRSRVAAALFSIEYARLQLVAGLILRPSITPRRDAERNARARELRRINNEE